MLAHRHVPHKGLHHIVHHQKHSLTGAGASRCRKAHCSSSLPPSSSPCSQVAGQLQVPLSSHSALLFFLPDLWEASTPKGQPHTASWLWHMHACRLQLHAWVCGRTFQGPKGGRGHSEIVCGIMADVNVLQSTSTHRHCGTLTCIPHLLTCKFGNRRVRHDLYLVQELVNCVCHLPGIAVVALNHLAAAKGSAHGCVSGRRMSSAQTNS